MSLSQVQQLYDILVRIDAILRNIHVKIRQIEHGGGAENTSSIRDIYSQMRQLEKVASRVLLIMSSMGIKDDTLTKITRIIVALRLTQIALMQVYALSGPVGWAFLIQAAAAGGSLVMAGMTINDLSQM